MRMIFHVAYPLDLDARSASGIRPVRMLEAFRDIGCEVRTVSGDPTERRQRIKQLRREIREGLKIDFVYSESATSPTGVGRPFTKHSSVTRDLSFLHFCSKAGIPVGLFYRDIYWRFSAYGQSVRWPLSAILRALYKWDLRCYRRIGLNLYLPVGKMQKWVPIIDPRRFRELPPGATLHDAGNAAGEGERLCLLYVGGLGNHYRLGETVRAIAGREDVELTICTRETEWRSSEPEYSPLLADNIRIVHASGAELAGLYRGADICVLAVEPFDYWEFAVPFKLFEYIGYGKPIVASQGTYPAEFVFANELGWVVRYGTEDLSVLLDRLVSDRQELRRVAAHVEDVRGEHTWEARARQVVDDLVGDGNETDSE